MPLYGDSASRRGIRQHWEAVLMITWQDVRALRAHPPDYATSGGRRQKTFAAALQQAEELAIAAQHAGYPTKPILLFYALSQGYRAACAAKLKNEWEPSGHGLSVPHRGNPLLDVAVKADDRQGLYQAAMTTCGESPLAGEATLGELWASSADLTVGAPSDVTSLPSPLTLHLPRPLPGESGAPDSKLFVLVEGLGTHETARELVDAIAPYPTLAEARPAPYPTGLRVGALSDEEGRGGVAYRRMPVQAKMFPVFMVDIEGAATFRQRFTELAPCEFEGWDGFRIAPPAVGNPPQILGPVSTWWPLMLGLASLARYYPATWSAALNVDQSALAVGLERLLDSFEEVLPYYIASGLSNG
jgi:hypothetical protein